MEEKPGYVNGKHFTEYSILAYQLKKDKKYEAAIELLLKIIDATEAESMANNWGIAPCYYETLANIYKGLKMFDKEKEILIRFSKQIQAPGITSQKLLKRLSGITK